MSKYWPANGESMIWGLLSAPPRQKDPQVVQKAKQLQALPVGWDLWSHWFLRPNGEVVIAVPEEDSGPVEVFTDRVKVLSALVMGRDLYPELAELLPVREPGASDCLCGELRRKFPRAICNRCGGVGWLPPDPDVPD